MSTLQRASALLIFLTFLSPLPAKPPQVLAEFPIFSDGDDLLLPVQVEGKRHLFVLDTGATRTIYDWSFRTQLGDPLDSETVETPKGYIPLSMFQAPEATVGKMSLHTEQERVFCTDLEFVREVSGHQIMGVIGLDFLRQYCIRIDFDAGKLQFLNAVGAEPGESIPMLDLGHYYKVKASVAGEEVSFMIDTGFGGEASGSLEAKLCERLMQTRKIKKVKDPVEYASGTFKVGILALNDFGFGPFPHHHLYFYPRPRNLLGRSYLSRYIVTFDFPNKKMYLKKGKRFDEPDTHDKSGLHMLRIDGQTVVKVVESGSPAARAGIEPKDILLKLNDLDADKTRMHVLRQQLARENETVHLRLRRGDKERELDLKLGK